MGAVAGMYSRVNGVVNEAVLDRLSQSLKRTGPDGEFRYVSGAIGAIHRVFYTDPASRRAAAPYVDADGSVVVWDGRLDNIDDLSHVLRPGNAGAPALVLAAYRNWGVRAFGQLVGDFSLVIWNSREKELILSVDALGRCPLYYKLTDEWCVWSSSSRCLLDGLRLSLSPNDEYIADYLANRPSTYAPLRGISFLSGGHLLRVRPEGVAVHRYWSFDTTKKVVLHSDADYEDCFTELFQQVVADRLSAEGPVFCELSGGVDSSTIACTAHDLYRRGRCEAPEVRTVSYVFNHAKTADERAYITLVEQHIGRPGLHISEDQCPVLAPMAAEAIHADAPTNQLCYLARQDYLAQVMDDAGARVVLSGIGGDQLFLSQPSPELLPLSDLLVRGQMRELLRSTYEWARVLRWPFWKTLWMGACWPLAPRQLQAAWQRKSPISEWLNEEFVRRTSLRERLLGMSDDLSFELPSQRFQYALVRQTMRPFALDRYLTQGCVDVRYPYLDRRLVEFALALPLDQKLRIGETRSIVRRAFRSALPALVRQRQTKAGPTEAFYRALVRQWPVWSAWLTDPRVCAYGYVDRKAFPDALARARHGVVTNCAQLTRVISLEVWLRSLDTRDTLDVESRAA